MPGEESLRVHLKNHHFLLRMLYFDLQTPRAIFFLSKFRKIYCAPMKILLMIAGNVCVSINKNHLK